MKKDLITYVGLAVICAIGGYLVCSYLLPNFSGLKFKALSNSPEYAISEPNPEIFNFRAVNPTVEVYVGQCLSYDANGICIDNSSIDNSGSSEDNQDNTNDEDI